MIRRREFITLLGGAVAAWPLAVGAQQQSRMWRVGYLVPSANTDSTPRTLFEAFRLKLLELGYVEDRNLILDVRRADGDIRRLPGLAAELVSLRPDVIVAVSAPAVSAVQEETSVIPIVMSPANDPVGNGFVVSLARPGRNITGLSTMTPDYAAKSLELLHTAVPSAKRIGVLMSANPFHPALLKEVDVAAKTLGSTLMAVIAALPSDLDTAFETMMKANCEGLVVLSDARVNASITALAETARLPAVYHFSDFVHIGGLMSYGPNFLDLFRRTAVYVDKIFKGADPAELPVEQPTKFELVINLKTAKALGLEVPPSLLARADEVIE
jgi:ABC-type uncharacterized transport system substrate-binding protein